MSVVIHGFQDTQELNDALLTVCHILGGSEWNGLVFTTFTFVIAWGLISARGMDPLALGKGIIAPILIYCAVMSATVNVNIVDNYYPSESYTVDDVPLGLALPLQLVSVIETNLIDEVDTHLNPVNYNFKFQDWGFLGHIQGLSEVNSGEIVGNDRILSTVSDFIQNCVLHGISNGDLVASDITNSGNLENYLNLSYTAFFTPVYVNGHDGTIMTCDDAYTQLTGAIDTEASSVTQGTPSYRLRNKLDPKHIKSVAQIRTNMDDLYQELHGGYQDQTTNVFKQMMWIKGLETNLAQYNPEMLSYQAAAYANNRGGENMLGAMEYINYFSELRPMLLILLIILFPFLGLFFFFNNGMPFKFWLAGIAWVTMWLPSQAIAHSIANYKIFEPLSDLIVSTGGGITFSNKMDLLDFYRDETGAYKLLVFMLPTIASMVVGWLMPKTIGSLSGMMMAGHRIAGQADKNASGAFSERSVDDAERGFAAEAERADIRSSGAGPQNLSQFGQNTGNRFLAHGGSFGTEKGEQPGTTMDRQSSNLPKMGIQSSFSSGYEKAVSQAKMQRSEAAQNASQNMSLAMTTSEGRQAVAQTMKSWSENNTFQENMSQNEQLSEQYGRFENIAKSHGVTDQHKIQDMFVETVGGSIGGGSGKGGGLGIGGEWSKQDRTANINEFSEQYGLSNSEQQELKDIVSKTEQNALSVASGTSTGISGQDGLTTTEQTQNAYSNALQSQKSYLQSDANVDSLIESQKQSSSLGGKVEANAGAIVANMDQFDYTGIKGTLKEAGFENTFSAMENGETNLAKLQSAMGHDFAESSTQDQQKVFQAIADNSSGDMKQSANTVVSVYEQYHNDVSAVQGASMDGASKSDIMSGQSQFESQINKDNLSNYHDDKSGYGVFADEIHGSKSAKNEALNNKLASHDYTGGGLNNENAKTFLGNESGKNMIEPDGSNPDSKAAVIGGNAPGSFPTVLNAGGGQNINPQNMQNARVNFEVEKINSEGAMVPGSVKDDGGDSPFSGDAKSAKSVFESVNK